MNRQELIDHMRGNARRRPTDQEIDALVRDANRYRFLRDSNDPRWRPIAISAGGDHKLADALVDAAMETSK